jgi:hypothetical protein
MESLPVLTEYSAEEKRVAELQAGFATRMRRSPYYIVEHTKSTGAHTLSDIFVRAHREQTFPGFRTSTELPPTHNRHYVRRTSISHSSHRTSSRNTSILRRNGEVSPSLVAACSILDLTFATATAAQPGARVNLDDMVEDGEDAVHPSSSSIFKCVTNILDLRRRRARKSRKRARRSTTRITTSTKSSTTTMPKTTSTMARPTKPMTSVEAPVEARMAAVRSVSSRFTATPRLISRAGPADYD